MTKKFWICLIEGRWIPQLGFFAHHSLEGAQEEASRLVRKEGKRVVIMEAIMEGTIDTEPIPPIRWRAL